MDKYFSSQFVDAGSFGRVYQMYSKSGGKIIAKKYTEKYGVSVAILNEIIFLSYIKHKNIIEKLDMFAEDNELYLIMPYYTINLNSWMRKNHKLENEYLQNVDIIISSILKGLEYIHKNNYIHADIKPTNIVLNPDNVEDVRIIDFGLTFHRKYNELNLFGIPELQTIWYRAPEIIYSQKYNYKIDIWSLGVMYLEILSGKCPLMGDNDEMQILLINKFNLFDYIVDNFPDPAMIFPQSQTIYKMLQTDPDARYDYIDKSDWSLYNFAELLKNEEMLTIKNDKLLKNDVLITLFNWMFGISDDFNNYYSVVIYACHLVIIMINNIDDIKLKPDLQLIALASLTIADNLFNLENYSKSKLVRICDEKNIKLADLVEYEFKILTTLNGKLQIITAIDAIHFFRRKFPDLYLEKEKAIYAILCALYINLSAFQYKPSLLIASIFYRIANAKIQAEISSMFPDVEIQIKIDTKQITNVVHFAI